MYQQKGEIKTFHLIPSSLEENEKTGEKKIFTPFLTLVKVIPRPKTPLKGSNLMRMGSWVMYWHMAMCF